MLRSSLVNSTTTNNMQLARAYKGVSLRTRAEPKMPKRGYFAEVDPNAEIYSKTQKKFDPTKKPGKWEPEFIWQTKWQEALALEEQTRKAQEEAALVEAPKPTGFLSLSRVNDINTMDADLNSDLNRGSRTIVPNIQLPNMTARYSYDKPTQAESRIWKRGTRLSERAFAVDPTDEEVKAAKEAVIKIEVERYEQLKREFQTWNLALAAFLCVVTYAFYTKEIAVSYLFGSIGGLIYLRLLNKQIDGFGGGSLASAVGPPRLLVPVILVLGYSRWNEFAVDPTGIRLDLIPMLLGFFTYKGAVIARQGLQLLYDLTEPDEANLRRSSVSQQPDEDGKEQGKTTEGPSIDDMMVRNILSR